MHGIFNFLRNLQKRIETHKKFLAGLSIFALSALLATYFFGETMPRDMCAKVLYTSAFSVCKEHIMRNVLLLEWVFGIIAFILPLFIILAEEVTRGRFIRFLKWFTPSAIVLALIGNFTNFCLMWSCSSMLGVALAIDSLVFLAFYFATGWSVLTKKVFMVFLFVPPLILAMLYGVITVAESIQMSSREIDLKAHNDGGNSCLLYKNIRERDQCLFITAFRCGEITSSDIKAECVAMTLRNRAVDSNNLSGCDEIIGEQRSVCRSLILERKR